MLNASVNIFGVLADGYTQYPDNYSQEIYTKFCELAKGESQIVIHRDGDLMYYGYVRRMDDAQQCIGFCIILNGVMFSSPCELLPVFESIVETLTVEGTIISFNEEGQIVPRIRSFVSMQQEVKRVENMILGRIGELSGNVAMLPPVDYSKPPTSIRFKAEDSREEIADAAWRYAYTVITAKGGDSQSLNGYRNVVKRLSSEKWKVTQELAALKEKHGKLKREKTQLMNVVILIILVAGCVVVLLAKVGALEQTQGELETEKERSAKLQRDANTRDEQIETLVNKTVDLGGEVSRLRETLKVRDDEIAELQSILSVRDNKIAELQSIVDNTLSISKAEIWVGRQTRTIILSYSAEFENNQRLKLIVLDKCCTVRVLEQELTISVEQGDDKWSYLDVDLSRLTNGEYCFQLWYRGVLLCESNHSVGSVF